jgi:hypothetical protein
VRARAVVLALGGLAAAACQTPTPPGVLLARDDPRPAALLAALSSQREARQAIRASARVSMSGQRGGSFARQLLLVERPARLRVEVMGLVGQRVMVLATDGERYDLYRSETGDIERGEIHPGILHEVAGVPLTPEQAVILLLGAPDAMLPAAPADEAHAFADGALRLAWRTPAGLHHVLVLDAHHRVRHYGLRSQRGRDLLRVEYDDYRPLDGVPFAHRVDFDFPEADARAEVSFRSVELNPVLPDELFRLALPERALPEGPLAPRRAGLKPALPFRR